MPPHTRFTVGDLVCGTDFGACYSITNADMTLGEVVDIDPEDSDDIRVHILEHSNQCQIGAKYWVSSKYFAPAGFCPACHCYFDPEDMADGFCPVCRARLSPV